MKNESAGNVDREKEWEQSLYAVPYTNADGLPLEPWTREAGAGLLLRGFRVVEMSDTGNGVELYPYFAIEPDIDKQEWEYYQRLSEKKKDLLSEPEQKFCEDMKEQLSTERAQLQKDAEALLDDYYSERGEETLEGVERLVVVRNGDEVNVIAPIGAPVLHQAEVADGKERTEEDKREREQLFTAEIERFGAFLKERYLNNGNQGKTH